MLAGDVSSGIWMSKISPVHIWKKKVKIQRDHKPPEAIMKKPLQNTAPPPPPPPPRSLQRMLLSLQKYDIDLVMTNEIPEEELTAQVHMVYENVLATMI